MELKDVYWLQKVLKPMHRRAFPKKCVLFLNYTWFKLFHQNKPTSWFHFLPTFWSTFIYVCKKTRISHYHWFCFFTLAPGYQVFLLLQDSLKVHRNIITSVSVCSQTEEDWVDESRPRSGQLAAALWPRIHEDLCTGENFQPLWWTPSQIPRMKAVQLATEGRKGSRDVKN